MKFVLVITLLCGFIFGMSLKKLDSNRIQISQGKFSLEIVLKKKNRDDKTKTYTIFRKDKDTSLIVFTHESEKGTVVLKENNNLYIKMPSSERAIRITPIQRLFGDASIGDVLEISFDDNYKKEKEENNKITAIAKNDKSTYQKIIIDYKGDKAISAELYSFSGKKLKTIFYLDKNKFKIISDRSESIISIKNYKKMTIKNRLFKKRNIKDAYFLSKRI